MYHQDQYLVIPKHESEIVINKGELLNSLEENFYSAALDHNEAFDKVKYVNVSNLARKLSTIERTVSIILVDTCREICN